MKLTGEEARRIVYDEHDDWSEMETEVVDTTRWSICKSAVYYHLPTGKYYQFNYQVGATEMQDEQPYECYKHVVPIEVRKVEVIKTSWEVVV